MPMGKTYKDMETYNKYVAMNKSDYGKSGPMKGSGSSSHVYSDRPKSQDGAYKKRMTY